MAQLWTVGSFVTIVFGYADLHFHAPLYWLEKRVRAVLTILQFFWCLSDWDRNLAAKTFRIYRIFSNTSLRLESIGTKELLYWVGALFSMQCIILGVWTGISPYKSRSLENC
jgi:hypothetical protein